MTTPKNTTEQPEYEYQWVYRLQRAERATVTIGFYKNEGEFFAAHRLLPIVFAAPIEATRRVAGPRILVYEVYNQQIHKRYIPETRFHASGQYRTFEEAKQAMIQAEEEYYKEVLETAHNISQNLERLHTLTEDSVVDETPR